MSPTWDALNSRARGLGTHLLPATALDRLGSASDLGQLVRSLERAGRPLAIDREAHPIDLELGIRRWAASQLLLLARWLGARTGTMAVLFLDEDRRSVRALLRGATAGIASPVRLAGLIPTPALPEAALEELSRQTRVDRIAALLSLWHHPFGAALQVSGSAEPSWFEVEIELSRTFAREALAQSRRGGSALQRYVRQLIDIENAWAALGLVGEVAPNELGDPFIPGGKALSRADFERAIKSANAGAAIRIIAGSFGRRALGAVFERHAAEPFRLEEAVLDWVIGQLRRDVLLSPLGPAPVIRYVLELRRECQRLRRIVWEVYLGLTTPRSPSSAAR